MLRLPTQPKFARPAIGLLCALTGFLSQLATAQTLFKDGFEPRLNPLPSYTIGGTVSGLAGSGLSLQLNGSEMLPINADGAFVFATALMEGAAYVVTVASQPMSPDQICTVAAGVGTMPAASVSSVRVTCTAAPAAENSAPGTNFVDLIDFIYDGSDPVQTGVDPDDIDPRQVTVARGLVLAEDRSPLADAVVTVLNHPQLGQTTTQADGSWMMAVNGGQPLVFDVAGSGLLPAQRRVDVGWNEYVDVPTMMLVALDPIVTTVSGNSSEPQVAIGSPISDARGARTGRLRFDAGTTFEMVMSDGTREVLPSMGLRVTEYTVGEDGPLRMPGTLPTLSGYTYAMELSADEALSAGATTIELSQPAYYYLDNFLDFPVGEIVPNGFYDRQQGLWLPDDNGLIIAVVGESGGSADVDVDGDGLVDTGASLSNLAIDADELIALAEQFDPGQSLWRMPMTHFTPFDFNFPTQPPEESEEPPEDEPEEEEEDPCDQPGSVIECQTRVLGEDVPLAGSSLALHYRSNRVPGFLRATTADIAVTNEILPGATIEAIGLELQIAGAKQTFGYAAAPGLSQRFTWDRRDAFGNLLQGRWPLVVDLSYTYQFEYVQAATDAPDAFGAVGTGVPIGPGPLDDLTTSTIQYLGLWDARGAGLGGWTLTPHHTLDRDGGVLYYGHGGQRREQFGVIIDTAVEMSADGYGMTVAPDGSMLVSRAGGCEQVWRYGVDGSETPLVGQPNPCQGDEFNPTRAVELPGSEIWFVETNLHRISRLTADGGFEIVAGDTGISGYGGDGGPAADALLNSPRGLALGPDGAVYFSDTYNDAVRRIRADGVIETFAGGNDRGYSGDGGPAQDAQLDRPGQLAFGPDGSLFVIDDANNLRGLTGTTRGSRIRRISPSGAISTVAGDGTTAPTLGRAVESGVSATSTGIDAESIVVLGNGDVLFTELINEVVRRIDRNGDVHNWAGMPGQFGYSGDGGPALAARFWVPIDLALRGDGTVLVSDIGFGRSQGWRLRSVSSGQFGSSDGAVVRIPREDGVEVYEFDTTGVHLKTFDGLTGATIYTFSYDSAGRLSQIDSPIGVLLSIARPDAETVTLTNRFGDVTTLRLDGEGWLASIEYPGGESRAATHAADGLLTTFSDFRGNTSTFSYNELGELATDTNRMGATASLAPAGGQGLDVAFTDFHGDVTTFQTRTDEFGNRVFERVQPWGGVTATVSAGDNLVGVNLEDGTQIDSQYGDGPRWDGAVDQEISRSIMLPSGLTHAMTRTLTASTTDDDPLATENMTIAIDVSGAVSSEAWDAATRTLTLTSAEGRVRTQTYDALGRVIEVDTDPALAPSVFTYNANGDLATIVRGTQQYDRFYDSNGRLQRVTNNAGLDEQFSYDANGHVTAITLASGRVLGTSRDAVGRLTEVTMPGGEVHALTYNANGRLASYQAPGNPERLFAARADGTLAAMTLESGRLATRTFDNSGRATGWSYPEATLLAAYQPATRLVESSTWTPVNGGAQTLTTGRDGALLTQFDWSGVANATVDLTWSDRFEWIGTALNGGPTRTIVRDLDGRIVGDGDFIWTRNNPGRAWDSISDSAATFTRSIDSLNREAVRSLSVNGVEVHRLEYGWRNDQRLASVNETVAGAADDRTFDYDADQRLISVADGLVTLESFEYDANDNLSTSTLDGAVTTRSYDTQDRITQIGATSVTVDVDGHTTAIGADRFAYDTRGQLLESTVNGAITTYTFDGLGRRVARTDDSGTTTYVYGNPDIEFRLTAVGEPSGIWVEFYYDENVLIALDRGGARYYVGSDATGSPRVVADASGNVVKTIDYTAFGEVIVDSNPGLELHIGFAGGLRDPTTGLLNFGLRDYHPALARWMRRDPALFSGGGMNLYAYVNNDPINRVDRMGLFGIFSPAGSAGAEYYSGFGGGVSLQSDGEGTYGICVKFGFGYGGSAGYDSGGRPDTYYEFEAGGCSAEASRRWNKCPPGSKRKGYWTNEAQQPGLGPIGLGADGPSFAPGAGCSRRVAFEACADI